MLKLEYFPSNPVFHENCWVAHEEGSAVLVDPGFTDAHEFAPFADFIRNEGLRLEAIFITHGHFDHIYGVNRVLDAFGDIPVYMHPDDVELIGMAARMAAPYDQHPDPAFDTVDVVDGDIINAIGRQWEVIATPGHTKGGLSFYCRAEKLLFSGDTLFAGSIGRTDLHGGSYDKLIVSIMDKLMGLDGDVEILPGHGGVSDIATERTHNPFLQPFNEPDDPDLSVEI